MTTSLASYSAQPIAPQADSDEHLIALWLHGRPASTIRAYLAETDRFLRFTEKPLRQTTLGDLQRYADSLAHLAPASRARCLNVVKSLFTFGAKLGYLPFNVAGALRVGAVKNIRAERILSEAEVHKMLALETSHRDNAILKVLYYAGLRVSEVCALRWGNLADRSEGRGQLTITGKGGKTRAVLLPASVYQEVRALAVGADPDAPVFRSRKKAGRLDPSQVNRIVRAAARRAGIVADVSPHWLRHAAASHAIERGAPLHVVQASLGHASLSTTGRYLHARPDDSAGLYLGA